VGGSSGSTIKAAWQEVFGEAAAANHASGGLAHTNHPQPPM